MKVKPSSKRGQVILELNREEDQLLSRGAGEPNAGAALKFKKLLVPIDFSTASIQALHYAESDSLVA